MTDTTGPTRRTVVGGIAGAGSMAALGNPIGPAQAQAEAKTFVLVPGAWHGGWCWRRVSDLLERRGHKVFTPSLTGMGERAHLMNAGIKLDTHITDVVNLIKWERLENFVLVGHSYGGFVVSGVAEQVPAIASIVFLDAFYPDSGQGLADMASPTVRDGMRAAAAKGDIGIPPRSAASFNVNEKDRAWVDAMCTPQPINTFLDKVVLTGARERIAKKAYIRARGYANPVFDKAAEKLKADSAWRVHDVPCGHEVMIDMPERLAELLQELA
jgi:pimeloyl-ACP methyl ester carboxylesterase